MGFRKIKLEFFHIRKSFFVYRRGWRYLYNKYVFLPQLLRRDLKFDQTINRPDLSLHILTCHRDTAMTIVAVASYLRVAKVIGQIYFHNDGTLSKSDLALLKKFFPTALVVNTADFIRDYGPAVCRHATICDFRTRYDNFSFKKIVDPYFVSDKRFRLILDSDILWFKHPAEIEANILSDSPQSLMQNNGLPIYATFADGSRTTEQQAMMNAGIIFYDRRNFDLKRLEEFLQKLDLNHPRNLHFADQAGHAYCLNHLTALPAEKYVIKDRVSDRVVAKHYTGPRRVLFYIEGLEILKINGLFANKT